MQEKLDKFPSLEDPSSRSWRSSVQDEMWSGAPNASCYMWLRGRFHLRSFFLLGKSRNLDEEASDWNDVDWLLRCSRSKVISVDSTYFS